MPDERADRSRVPRCVDSPGVVVGLAGCAGLEASFPLGPARCDLPWFLTIAVVSRGEFLRFAWARNLCNVSHQEMEEHGDSHPHSRR